MLVDRVGHCLTLNAQISVWQHYACWSPDHIIYLLFISCFSVKVLKVIYMALLLPSSPSQQSWKVDQSEEQ